MFDIFTDAARQVVLVAQDEAIGLGHDFIGTEHLLVGLASVTDGVAGQVLSEHGVTPDHVRSQAVRLLAKAGITPNASSAADALAAIGIDVQEIQKRADDTFGPGRFHFPRPVFTPRAKTVLELSLSEARELGHDHIGTEHVLLALLAENDGAGPAPSAGPAEAAGEEDRGSGNDGIQILGAVGADPAALRPEVLARLTPQKS